MATTLWEVTPTCCFLSDYCINGYGQFTYQKVYLDKSHVFRTKKAAEEWIAEHPLTKEQYRDRYDSFWSTPKYDLHCVSLENL